MILDVVRPAAVKQRPCMPSEIYWFLGRNIVTVEDPVRISNEGFNQVNIRADFGLFFPPRLRSILASRSGCDPHRWSPDSETLNIAVKAALTGIYHIIAAHDHRTGSILRMINMALNLSWLPHRWSPLWPSAWCVGYARNAGNNTRQPQRWIKNFI